MKVLVTGATGFIGRHLTMLLKSKGVDFVVLGRNFVEENGIRVDLLNTQNFVEIMGKIKPTHLIHLAWYADHGKYWDSALNIEWIRATFYLLDAFYKNGGEHALVTGTCAEYDWRYGYCVENVTPEGPKTLYGESKCATRRVIELIKNQYKGTLTWARIFYPYGVDEAQARLVPSLFRFFRTEEAPFGVNSCAYRDFLHISDTVDAIYLCATNKIDEIINICSGKAVLIESIVREIASICGNNADKILKYESIRKDDPPFLVGDNQKLRALGWTQNVSLCDGLLTY
ncbi:nucleoside-diphosphate-sugar epimerase [Desulfomicrobium macestii]|uniref:Nucleoside-diphosphate-sugar epimerase n=1 Tax=Desulfomicrobium macestii TaxID=90731 RepID=A0ABR9H6P6_9BACT|nr:NAD(P)-dependent oxidoreductase [Desulfomicrobium macestii]MBE1426387.1 nucleoside-diphosphate-sugar epimerase [Desulfomicrobium macestii]